MRIDQIEAAAAIAGAGGFGAAAAALGLPQPAVSRRVAALAGDLPSYLDLGCVSAGHSYVDLVGVYDLTAGAHRVRLKISLNWSWVSVVSVSILRALGRPPVEG